MSIEKVNGVPFNLSSALCRIFSRVTVGKLTIRERTAEIRNCPGTGFPSFLGDQVAHVGPGIEWLLKGGDRGLVMAPSQALDILAHPELERLRCSGLTVANHVVPARVFIDQFPTYVGNCPKSYPEHDQVEVIDDAKNSGAHLRLVPV